MTLLHQPKDIAPFLVPPRTVAVIGFHPDPSRPAHYVPEYLARQGFTVIPVNPALAERGESYFGQRAVARLADLTVPVDIVEIFRRSDKVPEHLEDILGLQPAPGLVWLQQGIRNTAVADQLMRRGINVVQDRCMLVDHRALG